MQDKRVKVFHRSLEELVESIDATLRLSAWDETEDVPDPLKDSASLLMTRLGTADRLAAGVFNGTSRDAARVNALTDAMRRLEAAYLSYAKSLDSGPRHDEARAELSATLDQVRMERLGAEE